MYKDELGNVYKVLSGVIRGQVVYRIYFRQRGDRWAEWSAKTHSTGVSALEELAETAKKRGWTPVMNAAPIR